MKKRHFIITGAVLLILILSFAGMKGLMSMKTKTPEKEKTEVKRYVKAEPVKYSDIKSSIKTTGRVASQNYVDLSSEVQGKILRGKVSMKKGESFKKGQLLVRIYSAEASLALQARKSRFMNSVANLLPDFKIDFKDSYENWLKFFDETKINKKIPKLPEIKSAQEKIYLASRNILSDYFTIKSEEIRLSKYAIYAPFNGSFTDVFAEPGAIANPGAKLAKMIRTDKLELEVPVEIENANRINEGNFVEIHSGNGLSEYKGKVIRKSDFVDPKTQSVSIFIALLDAKKVYQGEYMTALFSDINIKDAMEIPRNAVFNHNEIFTVIDGKLQKSTIDILKINEKSLIFNGINEGVFVVTEPLINAVENTDVEVID